MTGERVAFGWDVFAVHVDAFRSYVEDAGRVVRSFRGESAWSDAERLAGDIVTERRFAR